jgi:hypothetical protein
MEEAMSGSTRRLAAAASVAAVFAAAFLAASCSYFTDDPYPDSAQRLLARTDFDSILREAPGGSKLQDFGAFSYVKSPAGAAFFVGVHAKDGADLFLSLDGDRLDEPVIYPSLAPESVVSYDASGMFIASDWLISTSRAPLYSQAFTASPFFLSEGSRNYNLALGGPSILKIEAYDSGYAPIAAPTILIAAAGSWNLVSTAQAGGWYCLLFQDGSSNGYRGFRIESIKTLYDKAAALAWSSLFDDANVPAACKGPLFQADYNSAWLTKDGVVTRSYVDNGVEFTLNAFSGSDESYTASKGGEDNYYFEPSGKYWFVYGRSDGRLSKLRTWW